MATNRGGLLTFACTGVAMLFGLVPVVTLAATLHEKDSISQWFIATNAEQLAYAEQFVNLCKPIKCTTMDIKKCMDESFRHFAKEAPPGMFVGDSVAMCVSNIESVQWTADQGK
jgi:hypothetical protein